jgi:GNAT superfamily N-acetyltransferase
LGSSAGSEVTVRPAKPEDVERITDLCGQLGYPSTVEQVQARLAHILLDPMHHQVFVAETAEHQVTGWIHICVLRALESDRQAEIWGLVVDENHRSGGVGQLLIERAEAWAREHDCLAIGVHSNVIRERAHEFYKRHGYEIIKTQRVFRKRL